MDGFTLGIGFRLVGLIGFILGLGLKGVRVGFNWVGGKGSGFRVLSLGFRVNPTP